MILGSIFKHDLDIRLDHIQDLSDKLRSVDIMDKENLRKVSNELEEEVIKMCNDIRIVTFDPDQY